MIVPSEIHSKGMRPNSFQRGAKNRPCERL